VTETVKGRRAFLRTLVVGLVATPAAAQQISNPRPGAPTAGAVVLELRQALSLATTRLHAMDEAGVLSYVSDRYRSSSVTKSAIREQLRALFTLYEAVHAKARIDDVHMVGEDAWVYSTGELSGRLRGLGTWMPILSWRNEPEVARRERGVWRLYGDQT
jgi:hypothetical protein